MRTTQIIEQEKQEDRSRVNVLGVGVDEVDMRTAVKRVIDAAVTGRKGYVCVTGVHGIMEAQKDQRFRSILNSAMLVAPDGMPTVWVGRLKKHGNIDRVFGPEFMIEVCRESVHHGLTHFFYGGNDGVAQLLRDNLEARIPGLQVVGTYTPPFRKLNDSESADLRAQVDAARPDFFWVGLSTPKQERFMAEYLPLLKTTVMFGVGAAFDVHTGRIRDCDPWVKSAGLQWLHRLIQEPRRLWKRYLTMIPRFLFRITQQMLGLRKYEITSTKEENE